MLLVIKSVEVQGTNRESEKNVTPKYELKRAILWSVESESCKQPLCPDEILSLYYLNLNARSFVKWFRLRSPNRYKFSRVAKRKKIKSILACFALGGTRCFSLIIARRHTFWLNRFIFFPPRLEIVSLQKQYLIIN